MMFRAEKARLAAILGAVDAVVKPKNTIPILQHVVFERRDATVVVRGSDLGIEIIGEAPAEFGPDFFAFTCESRSALEFVRSAPASEIAVSASGEDRKSVTLSSGRSRIRLPIMLGDDFPRLTPADGSFELECVGEALAQALQQVAYAADTSIAAPQLCGVLLEGDADGVSLVATNTMQLQKRLVPAALFGEGVDLSAMPRITIPTDSVARIVKLANSEKPCVLSIASNRLAARVGDVMLVTKLVEEKFPPWRRIIPTEINIIARVGSAELDGALTRAMLANKPDDHGVWLTFRPGSLSLEARGPEGEARDEIDCVIERDIAFPVNGKQVLDALARVKAEHVEFALVDADDKVTLRAAGDVDNFAMFSGYKLLWRPSE